MLVRISGADAVADLVERKLYLKAKWARKLPEIEKLLDRAKLENIVTDRDGLPRRSPRRRVPARPRRRGVPRRRPRSGRIVLDPYWLGGGGGTRAAPCRGCASCWPAIRCCRSVKELEPREAARLLASGQLPGAAGKALPFLNPHLAGLDAARTDQLRAQHERLFTATKVVILNTAVGSTESLAARIVEDASK